MRGWDGMEMQGPGARVPRTEPPQPHCGGGHRGGSPGVQRSPLGEDSRVWALLGAAIWQSRVMAPLGILVDLGMCVLMCPSAEPAALGALWHGLCHPACARERGVP